MLLPDCIKLEYVICLSLELFKVIKKKKKKRVGQMESLFINQFNYLHIYVHHLRMHIQIQRLYPYW